MTTHGQKNPTALDDSAATEINEERRAALKSVAKYAAFMAGTSAVILTPETALAKKKPCSQVNNPNPKNCV